MFRFATYFVLAASAICVAVFSYTNAGIIRHDVDREDYVALAKQPQFDCVGICWFDINPEASCVLVGKKYVLSSARTFMRKELTPADMTEEEARNGTIGIEHLDGRIIRLVPKDLSTFSFHFGEKIYYAVGMEFYRSDDENTPSADLVLIELANEVQGIDPALLYTGHDEKGTVCVAVGYDYFMTAYGLQGSSPEYLKLAGQNTIDSLGAIVDDDTQIPTTLLADFDSPDSPEWNRMGSAMALSLEFVLTPKDFGGGIFIQVDEKWQLAGIASSAKSDPVANGFLNYYGTVCTWTRVSVFRDWIEEKMKNP